MNDKFAVSIWIHQELFSVHDNSISVVISEVISGNINAVTH